MRKIVIFLLVAGIAAAADPAAILLPKPETGGGMPLMEALAQRQSGRDFSPAPLSPEILSNLLWAADGVNRPGGRRTAPSANNRQTVDIYAVLPGGVYLYHAGVHRLDPVASGDLRAATGVQPFAAGAPLNLVYVSDYAKMAAVSDADKALYAAAETGFIGQNVYLYCASKGLAAVVRALVNRDALSQALKLRPTQKITLAQTVGYPAPKK